MAGQLADLPNTSTLFEPTSNPSYVSLMDRKPRPNDRILVILDLDETLVYATEDPLDRLADFVLFDYHVYKRPNLDEFLREISQHFYVAVWSSASDDYVTAIVNNIFPDPSALEFVWGRSRATLGRGPVDEYGYTVDRWDHTHYLKPLTKVRRAGWSLDRVLIVDDTPEKSVKNYGNAIYPQAYDGAESDRELDLLAAYLKQLKGEQNIRRIEKRRWRDLMMKSD